MNKGKDICNALKEIRRQIADNNGIKLEISECTFQGECRGTCPKCEAEIRYLDTQLQKRHRAGHVIKVAGIAAGTLALLAPITLSADEPGLSLDTTIISSHELNKRIEVTEGVVSRSDRIDLNREKNKKSDFKIKETPVETETFLGEVFEKSFSDGSEAIPEPILGAVVLNTRTQKKAYTDLSGKFEIDVQKGDILRIMYIGCEPKEIAVIDLSINRFYLLPSKEVLGKVMVLTDDYLIGKVVVKYQNDGIELRIQNKNGKIISPERYAIPIQLLETERNGKPIKNEDGYDECITITPASEDSEKIFISYTELFNRWFSLRKKDLSKEYPQKMRLRVGDGYFADTKDIIINISKDAINSDSANRNTDWDLNLKINTECGEGREKDDIK